MTPGLFNTTTVIEKLVIHYGLPAFLFDAPNESNILLKDTGKQIRLVPYSDYNQITSLVPLAKQMFLFEDLWNSKQEILASQISRHAGYHEKISARSGRCLALEKKEAAAFFERYHLMGQTTAAFYYGIVHEKQLVAAASFSKGRKMDRLPTGILSYELVRLASLPHLTVTGSLSRLVQQFYRDHQTMAGDLMTYVDPLLGDKTSFEKNGFTYQGKTKPVELFVDPLTHQRYFKDPGNIKQLISFYTTGNDKLIKTF